MSAVSEKPILFTGPNVRAILAGVKTQTRRHITHKALYAFGANPRDWSFVSILDSNTAVFERPGRDDEGCAKRVATIPVHYRTGDLLWVREAWATSRCLTHIKPSRLVPGAPCEYAAGGTAHNNQVPLVDRGKWRPSIHMPRWASRLTLKVLNIRVERLQSITDSDAIAEGICHVGKDHCGNEVYAHFDDLRATPNITLAYDAIRNSTTATEAYARVWDDAYKTKAPWSSNPFVLAVEFKVIEFKRITV